MATVRLAVCGDEGTGKSSLITSLVKDVFVTTRIPPVLPPISLPPSIGTPENVTTWIIDTSAAPQERSTLRNEIRKCNVILLVYSDPYSYERVALFWMPYFRSLGVNVPVVLCANKSDLARHTAPATAPPQAVIEEELLPVMAEFKEIDSCIRTSSREHYNVNEVFYLCQKAVTHPIAPLYDAKESALKPDAQEALKRIFYLCDKDQDGLLNDAELQAFQQKCFDKPLADDDLTNIKRSLSRWSDTGDKDTLPGVDMADFLLLNKMFVEKGRHETVWIILRKFSYTDSLVLRDEVLRPKLNIPDNASVELSPAGYRFFFDLFVRLDADNDGVLNASELHAAFAPTPGIPEQWTGFPACTVCNATGHVTLQGWLAQWSMTTYQDPYVTLMYLAYLGYEPRTATAPSSSSTVSALKVTKARKRRPGSSSPKTDRNVFNVCILGAPRSGKTTILNTFLNRPFQSTDGHREISHAVNTTELSNGKQPYLILHALNLSINTDPSASAAPSPSPSQDNLVSLRSADLICYTYDSSDPLSFGYILSLQSHPHLSPILSTLPSVYVATKADRDRAVQTSETSPEDHCSASSRDGRPMHVSALWSGSVADLCTYLAECAADPGSLTEEPGKGKGRGKKRGSMHLTDQDGAFDGSLGGWTGIYVGIGAVVCALAAGAVVWRRSGLEA